MVADGRLVGKVDVAAVAAGGLTVFTPKALNIVAQGQTTRVLRAAAPPWVEVDVISCTLKEQLSPPSLRGERAMAVASEARTISRHCDGS
jgi:hypothetical protein